MLNQNVQIIEKKRSALFIQCGVRRKAGNPGKNPITYCHAEEYYDITAVWSAGRLICMCLKCEAADEANSCGQLIPAAAKRVCERSGNWDNLKGSVLNSHHTGRSRRGAAGYPQDETLVGLMSYIISRFFFAQKETNSLFSFNLLCP